MTRDERFTTINKNFIIKNKVGLHARPATLLVQTSRRYESKIEIRKNNHQVNGKSLLSILSLGAEQNSMITIIAQGVDAAYAIQDLAKLIESNFGEPE